MNRELEAPICRAWDAAVFLAVVRDHAFAPLELEMPSSTSPSCASASSPSSSPQSSAGLPCIRVPEPNPDTGIPLCELRLLLLPSPLLR